MLKRQPQSRRNFLLHGITATAGLRLFSTEFSTGINCPEENVKSPGTIPLNNILTSLHQEEPRYGFGLLKKTVCDHSSWQLKRDSILQRAKILLGEKPPDAIKSVQSENISKLIRNDFEEIKLRFPSGTGDFIYGYLLVPETAKINSPSPAMLALHSTGPGARQTIGLEPKENRMYGLELAKRGYVVLAIDVISAGDRVYPGYDAYYTDPFYAEFPRWSAMGKMIHDHQKGLDYLQSLEFVDSDRIGCIGHSLGGYNAFFLQAFDERIKAAVSSCGLSPLGGSLSPYQFARNDWFVHFNPITRDFISSGMIPCDMHEIMALCAPRPLFNYSARQDGIYCPASVRQDQNFTSWWSNVEQALDQVRQVYDILGSTSHFVSKSSDGGHDFPRHIREEAYQWLDSFLLH